MALSIELDRITLRRGRRTLLDRLTWRVPAGSCCAVMGPNGAGKSTLLAVVCGYMWPQEGAVRVLGERYGQVDLTFFRRRIGVLGISRLPEFHPDMSALEIVLAGLWGAIIIPPHAHPTEADWAAARRELHVAGMESRADEPLGNLSTGEQMRTLLARALVAAPELLILDEPTSGLDMAARAAFKAALDRLRATRPQMTVIFVTQYVEDLPASTEDVLLLREGRVVAAGPLAGNLNSESLSRTFGCPVELAREDGQFWTRVRPAEAWTFD